MMFMSSIVYFIELMIMSLTGIMIYKLYISYKNWKIASAFSAKPSSNKPSTLIKNAAEQNPLKFVPEPVSSDYLAVNKISVTEVNNSSYLIQKNKQSSILDDYIGEFFTETESVDIDAYRARDSVLLKASQESSVPTLKEFSDIEPDSFITVASVNDEEKDNNKVMSDKVVLAMLDEAKLVCAS